MMRNAIMGYKGEHFWVNKGTEQHPIPENRSTLFQCNKCNILFRHWYHVTDNIFEAMKRSNIKDECEVNA